MVNVIGERSKWAAPLSEEKMDDAVKETREALKEAEANEDVALAAVLREKLSDLADLAKAAKEEKAER